MVANRTYERARELATRHGAVAMHYEECWAALDNVDVLLCSTAAPRPVVTMERVRGALERRKDRPLCVLDIAVPRDVEPEIGTLDNVFLYDLDDLRAVVDTNIERRRAELPTAEQLIEAEVQRYWEWLAGLAAVPVLTRFRGEMERVREREVTDALRQLAHLPAGDRAVVEQLSRSLMNKFLHGPTVRLRDAAANGRGLGVVDAMRYLFGLDEGVSNPDGVPPEHSNKDIE
jgi:glutamyl-tRNA reductase